MTPHDAFFDDAELSQPDWMANWVNAELDALTFNVCDAVLNRLDKPEPLIDGQTKVQQVMGDYYDTVAAQCPDLWPAVLTQLNRSVRVLPVKWSRLAASLLVVLMAGSTWAWLHQSPSTPASAVRQVASLPVTPAITSLADPVTSTAVKPVIAKAKIPAAMSGRRMMSQLKPKLKRPRVPSAGSPVVLPRAQRVQQAILAEAAQNVKRQAVANAPGSLDYVFNVSSPAKDDLVLGLASP
jgi:hypothetical protein